MLRPYKDEHKKKRNILRPTQRTQDDVKSQGKSKTEAKSKAEHRAIGNYFRGAGVERPRTYKVQQATKGDSPSRIPKVRDRDGISLRCDTRRDDRKSKSRN
jgi:hypothetical protein